MPSERDPAAAAAVLGRAVVRLATTTSTNDVARDLAQRGAPDGTLVIAEQQTAGRGRRGRAWLAQPGQALLFSLILRPTIAPAYAARLTMLAAVAVASAVRDLGAAAAIKWPNDVVIGGRKLAGILVETSIVGDRLDYAVLGIGVNVNVAEQDVASLAPQATSLLAETGRAVDRERLLSALLAGLDARYAVMARDGGRAVHEEWTALLETVGRDVTVHAGEDVIAGRAVGVDAEGALLVRQADGTVAHVTFGDVS